MLSSPYPSTASPLILLPLFFFNATATTQIYTLSLHDALPISYYSADFGSRVCLHDISVIARNQIENQITRQTAEDRKSTRLNSSHVKISYAVFCLKKKKNERISCHRHSSGTLLRTLPILSTII